jgi:hypothetical protein
VRPFARRKNATAVRRDEPRSTRPNVRPGQFKRDTELLETLESLSRARAMYDG